jgi:outer membrane immunogenic protein
MTRSLIAGLGLLAIAAAMPATAADLPRSAVPYQAPSYVSGFNWTGFYVGLNGGGSWGGSDWDGYAVSNSPRGGLLGVTAGYNWQGAGSPWVFGLEGDVDWAFVDDSVLCGTGINCQTKNNWLGTVRGRVGYAFGRVMPYATGGLAFGDIKANVTAFPGVSDTNLGWTIGAGVEASIYANWTGKIEYLYADLGSVNCTTAACGVAGNVDLRQNILRAGLNYHF